MEGDCSLLILSHISAIIKDLLVAILIRIAMRFEKTNANRCDVKYMIFLLSFLMEDFGQILCQEIIELIDAF